jgi:hypothetical protein
MAHVAHWREVSQGLESASGRGHVGQLFALYVTAANVQDRAQVEQMARAVRALTAQSVKLAFADQAYTARQPGRSPGTPHPAS